MMSRVCGLLCGNRPPSLTKMSIPLHISYGNTSSVPPKVENLTVHASRLQTVDELCREIFSEIEGHLSLTLDNFSLFHRKKRQWLNPLKYVWEVTCIEPGVQLEFIPKKRYIKIRFLDGASKTVLIDETQTVSEIAREVCASLRLDKESQDDLSLLVAKDYSVNESHPVSPVGESGSVSPITLRHLRTTSLSGFNLSPLLKSKSPKGKPSTVVGSSMSPSMRRKGIDLQKSPSAREHSGSRPRTHSLGSSSLEQLAQMLPQAHYKKQMSKKYQLRLDTPWLDPSKTLGQQGVDEDDDVILMYRYFYHLNLHHDSMNVEILFKQASVTFLAGEVLCTEDEMASFAALLCHIHHHEYDSQRTTIDFYHSIRSQIIPSKCKLKNVYRQLCAQHSALKGLSVQDAKCCFVKLWSTLPLFGLELLSCVNVATREKGIIGVSKRKIIFLPHHGKKSLSWDLADLLTYEQCDSTETVTLVFKPNGALVGDILKVELLDYSGVLADCLQGHRERSADVSNTSWESRHFSFDVAFETKFHQLFLLSASRKQSGTVSNAVGLDDLTYNQVYWASRINNPMFSDEELAEMHGGHWQNPAYQNMEQLMDERFSFLDNSEYADDDDDNDDDVEDGLETTRRHAALPSLKAMLSSAKVAPQVFDGNHKFQRKAKSGSQLASDFNRHGEGRVAGTVQSSSPLLSRSVSGSNSHAQPGHSSPFTGSPIIFRKDFLKGSSSSAPESRFRF